MTRSRVLIATFVAAVAAVVMVTTGVIAGDDDAVKREEGKQIGSAFTSAEKTPVLVVNGNTVSEARFQLSLKTVNHNIRFMNEFIKTNESPGGVDNMARRLEIIETTGVDDVALAGVLVETAIEDAAIERGFTVSESELAERLAFQRQAIESGQVPAVEGFAGALGDSYWTEYMPDVLRRAVLVERLREIVFADVGDFAEKPAKWTEFERNTVKAASVEIVAPDKIGSATLDGAMAYLESLWALPG